MEQKAKQKKFYWPNFLKRCLLSNLACIFASLSILIPLVLIFLQATKTNMCVYIAKSSINLMWGFLTP
jgi:ABC-type sulfate transport system permease subunit